jgi:hypothetical protein
MNQDELRHAQALAYVWGRRDEREDAAGDPATRGSSTDFAEWYCLVQRTNHHTIADRYNEWLTASQPAADTLRAQRDTAEDRR